MSVIGSTEEWSWPVYRDQYLREKRREIALLKDRIAGLERQLAAAEEAIRRWEPPDSKQ